VIKRTHNHKGNENLKVLEKIDELFKQEPEKQLQEKQKTRLGSVWIAILHKYVILFSV